MGEEPEKQREDGAEKQTGDDGKVKGGVFAAMDDIAGEPAEAEGELGTEIKKRAEEDEEGAEKEKSAAKFTHWIHG